MPPEREKKVSGRQPEQFDAFMRRPLEMRAFSFYT
jgi:hypothetical protein